MPIKEEVARLKQESKKKQEQKKAKQKADAKKAEKAKAREDAIIENFIMQTGVKKLLEEAQEIWGAGSITENPAQIALVVPYQRYYPYSVQHSDYDDIISWERVESITITICVRFSFLSETELIYMSVNDNESGNTTKTVGIHEIDIATEWLTKTIAQKTLSGLKGYPSLTAFLMDRRKEVEDYHARKAEGERLSKEHIRNERNSRSLLDKILVWLNENL